LSGSGQYIKAEEIDGISKKHSIEKFIHNLKNRYDVKQIPDKGPHVLVHIKAICEGKNFDVIVYKSSKIKITSSKIESTRFNIIANEIFELARTSDSKISETRGLFLQRAKSIVNHIVSLNLDDETNRMLAVILSDTSNEIVITELMQYEKIDGSPLEDNLPNKIKQLKKKNKIIFKELEIMQVRTLRNSIVHQGNIPFKEQAQQTIDIAKEVLDHI
jgi:hypothetical protein